VSKDYDGYIAKDKDGVYWLGTLGREMPDVESNVTKEMKKNRGLKFVKVKLVEVK